MAVKCQCGNVYNSKFKFCPECAAANPELSEENKEQPIIKKGFTKVGESSLNKSTATIVRNPSSAIITRNNAKPIEEYYEDDIDEAEEIEQTEEKEQLMEQPQEQPKEIVAEPIKQPVKNEAQKVQKPIANSEIENIGKKTTEVKNEKVETEQNHIAAQSDPNYDGYYDDRLPAIANEITKTSYRDIIIKFALCSVGVIAILWYLIYFLI